MSVTAEQVKDYREEHGVGLFEASRVLRRSDLLSRVRAAREGLYGRQWEGNPTCEDLITILDIIKDTLT